MQKKKALLLGAVGLLIVIIFCVIYSQQQQKNDEYSYELLRVKSSLEQIVQYSENCISSISLGENEETHGELMSAVTMLDLSTSKIALLHNRNGLSSQIFNLSDHLNGTYPDLPNDTKLYWLECIRDASKEFLSAFEQTETISINDFVVAVNEFSSALPTNEL